MSREGEKPKIIVRDLHKSFEMEVLKGIEQSIRSMENDYMITA